LNGDISHFGLLQTYLRVTYVAATIADKPDETVT